MDIAIKTDLANLKANVDKLDTDILKFLPTSTRNLEIKVEKLEIDILLPVPVDWSKLSDTVKNDVVKKDPYNAKIKNAEDEKPYITNLASNTIFNDNINKIKNEIFSITDLVTNASRNGKRNVVKDEIPSITNLATIAPLTTLRIKYLTWVI